MARKARGLSNRPRRRGEPPAAADAPAAAAAAPGDPADPEYVRVVEDAHAWLLELRAHGYHVPADDPDVALIERAFASLQAEASAT